MALVLFETNKTPGLHFSQRRACLWGRKITEHYERRNFSCQLFSAVRNSRYENPVQAATHLAASMTSAAFSAIM